MRTRSGNTLNDEWKWMGEKGEMNMKNSVWMADLCQDSNWAPSKYKTRVVTFMLPYPMMYICKCTDMFLDLVYEEHALCSLWSHDSPVCHAC
jgi:hypothetical protein